MTISHNGFQPEVDESSFIAPNAMICGKVTIGKNCRIMYGAQIIAEQGQISIGDDCVILENAVLRSTEDHDLSIDNSVLIGPQAHIVGAHIGELCFIATGASIFHGAKIGKGSEVRINAVVHINTLLEESSMVPIGWVAVGSPAEILPPHEHDKIWAIQKELDFPMTVYGVDRNVHKENTMKEIIKVMVKRLSS